MLRLRVAEVILLPLGIWPYVLRRHQPGIVAESFEFPTEMMRSDAGVHPDQARRHIGKTSLYLATRPLLTRHDRTTIIEGYDVE